MGKVKNLTLTGDFSVRITFDAEDVEGLLQSFDQTRPPVALKLAESVQAATIIALTMQEK